MPAFFTSRVGCCVESTGNTPTAVVSDSTDAKRASTSTYAHGSLQRMFCPMSTPAQGRIVSTKTQALKPKRTSGRVRYAVQ
eukprot:3627982-Rhodomonas_salina.2